VSWLPATDCTIVELLNDGTPVVRFGDGVPRPVPVHGIQVPQPPPDLYLHILSQRLRADQVELRCELASEATRPGRYSYLAWHDKTGAVWRDLAKLLISQGVARVADDTFPERDEYLQAETAARTEQRGLWASQR
jgi:hypothetical protein